MTCFFETLLTFEKYLQILEIIGKRENLMRINQNKANTRSNKPSNQTHTVEIKPVPLELIIAGRVVLNLWRILKSEITLNIYTIENCCFSILNERTPKYNFSTLTNWFSHRTDLFRSKAIEYYSFRTETNLRLIISLDLIGKTCEFAKVYGIEFYHVFSRGLLFKMRKLKKYQFYIYLNYIEPKKGLSIELNQ